MKKIIIILLSFGILSFSAQIKPGNFEKMIGKWGYYEVLIQISKNKSGNFILNVWDSSTGKLSHVVNNNLMINYKNICLKPSKNNFLDPNACFAYDLNQKSLVEVRTNNFNVDEDSVYVKQK